jgi:hypothetical protein
MSTSRPSLPKYNKCKYSLFVSYAHADNRSNNGWITSLRDAIWDRLSNLPRHIVQLELHLSQENGATAGHLNDRLRTAVTESFGMLLVIGENYVNSGWCEKELELFGELFGREGTKTRLYIVAMSQSALDSAKQGARWREVVSDDQVWVPMYQDTHPNLPIERGAPDGGRFSDQFFAGARAIADPLISCIKDDFEQESDEFTRAHGAGPRHLDGSPRRAPWPGSKRIGIGPFTPNLEAHAERLRGVLARDGADILMLSRQLIDDYDPDDGKALRDVLEQLDFLVVPLADVKPLLPAIPGGHTTVIQQERAKLKSAALTIVWYRPDDVPAGGNEAATAKHTEKFKHLAPVCASEQAVANVLFGAGAGHGVKIYVENHPKEPAYFRLVRELEAAWAALPPDPQRPQLKCAALDLDAADSASKDAAGVVLLLPDGLKDPASIAAQIKLVEDCFPKNTAAYPGCVALLFKPPPRGRVARHEWTNLKFQKSEQEPKLVIENESRAWLDEFLNNVWMQYQKDMSAAAHS